MGKVRMADIAARLGVSSVTVHNALTGRKGVSDEMRARIINTAKEMGYQTAKQIQAPVKSTGLKAVGILISEKYLADYMTFYWKMYQELTKKATDKGCAAIPEIVRHQAEDSLTLPRIIEERAVEGVIVIGQMKQSYLQFLKANISIPLIFLDFYDRETAQNAVVTDNFYGMYMLTELLFDKGINKIAYVGSIHATSSIMDRYCGFHKALMEHGEILPPEWLMEDRNADGYIILELPKALPQAFVCNCDLVATILISKLEERGLRVPEDISVVGFDNYCNPGYPDRGITTYEVNMPAMTEAALQKVLDQIKNPKAECELTVISGRIIEKNSVRAGKVI